jgi:hypothetical protein
LVTAADVSVLIAALVPFCRTASDAGFSGPRLEFLVSCAMVEASRLSGTRSFAKSPQKTNASRIAADTGYNRTRVRPLIKRQRARLPVDWREQLLADWPQHKDGCYKPIPIEGRVSFEALTMRRANDIPYRAVLAGR